MQLALGVREAIEAIVIISVFGTTGYAVHRLRNQRKPAADVSTPGPAIMAAFFRSCWKWVAGLLTLVLVVVLALVRGITSGGGIFSPELDKVQLALMKKMPARALTRMWWYGSRIPLVPVVREVVLGCFCIMFGVKRQEAEEPDIRKYSSLHSFFTRRLSKEVRPICPEHSLVSPSDGRVLHVGKIEGAEVKQVKGVNYKLLDFLGDCPLPDLDPPDSSTETLLRTDSLTNLLQTFPHVEPSSSNELYHAVVYLRVADYHHFHSPTDWNIQMRRHIVGELLSVAPWVIRKVPNLFALSERVLLGGYWEHGFFSLTAVGAYNVGSIEIDMDKELATNSSKDEDETGMVPQGKWYDRIYCSEGVPARKGDHMGLFHLGSTIVLVFEAPKSFEFSVRAGEQVNFGQPLGFVRTTEDSMEE